VEVWQTSNLQQLRLGEEKKKKEEERRTNHSVKIYMVSLFHRATINNSDTLTLKMITALYKMFYLLTYLQRLLKQHIERSVLLSRPILVLLQYNYDHHHQRYHCHQ